MFFSYNGRQIFYSDSGKGRPVVLLHGYLESSEIWNGFAEKLAAERRVICIDIPGHGSSSTYSDVHTMEFLATAVKNLLDNLGINRIFLTGHSMGGYVTLAFLELYPEYLTGYCLFHSQPFADTPETVENRKKESGLALQGRTDLFYPDSIKKMFATSNLDRFSAELQRSEKIASETSGEGIAALLNGMILRPSRLELMEKGRVPCLWILGAMDNYINCESIQSRVNLPANAEVTVLNGSGHMGFIEEQDLSVKIMLDFTGRLHW